MAKKLRRWSVIAFVNLAVFLFLFLVAELVYRMYRDGVTGAFKNLAQSWSVPYSNLGTANWVIYDPELGYRVRSGRPGVNSRAVYGPEIVVPKPPGLFRIIVLGDSVPLDIPGFVSYLDEWLRPRGNVEIIRATIPGYTSYQEVLLYKKYLAATKPDLVLWTYCLNDNHKFLHRFSEKGGMLWTDEARDSLKVNTSWDKVVSRSYLLTLLRVGGLARAKQQEQARSKFPWEHKVDFNIAWKDYSWADYESNLVELQTSIQQQNGRLAIVIFPYEPQLQLRDDKDNHDYILKPQLKLAALYAKYHVPYLDLYPSFAAEYDRGQQFYRDGIHLNEAGHRFTFDKVSQFLIEQGLPAAVATRHIRPRQ